MASRVVGMGKDGAVVRTLASNQCDPGSIPAPPHMWDGFAVGSPLAPLVFLPLSSKKKIHIGSTWKAANADVTSSLKLIYLFYITYNFMNNDG